MLNVYIINNIQIVLMERYEKIIYALVGVFAAYLTLNTLTINAWDANGQVAFGEKYPPKEVTMNVTKNEMVYCSYGNSAKATVVCDSIELKSRFDLIDRFLEVLEYGPNLDRGE